MNLFCRLLGHTWIHKTEDAKVAWNNGKDLAQLHQTVEGESRFILVCHRCGLRNENPSRAEIKAINN